MALSRFFLTSDIEDSEAVVSLPLSPDDLHHAISVLRATVAEKIAVVEPSGRVLEVELRDCSKKGLCGRVVREVKVDPLPPVVLIQGVSKGERMDLTIRMSVEVGVEQIVPVLTQRCTVKLDDEKKVSSKQQRWERIAHAAAKQSGRIGVPEVHAPVELKRLFEAAQPWDTLIVAWEEDDIQTLHQLLVGARLRPIDRVAIVIGPEGGLTSDEVAFLKEHGAQTCTLGDTILRTETAAVVATSLLLYERGALGGQRLGG